MTNTALIVFTYRTVEQIKNEGGSQAWSLRPANARKCEYLVCTRNRYQPNAGTEPHQSAFLVGRISSVDVSPERGDRWIVRISEYALVSMPNVWPGSRNPVWYSDLETLGIDPSKLDWEPMPLGGISAAANMAPLPDDGGEELSVDELKAAVAAAYGVGIEQVEVTIRF